MLHNNKSLSGINVSCFTLSSVVLVYIDVKSKNTGESKKLSLNVGKNLSNHCYTKKGS